MSSLSPARGGAATAPGESGLVAVTGLLLACAPLFVLTLSGWANAVLFLAALLALVQLANGSLPAAPVPAQDRLWTRLLVAAYVAPIVATAWSALLRHDFAPQQFDAPSRFLLAIPVFLFVLRSGWSTGRAMRWVLPVALVVALANLALLGPDKRWVVSKVDRVTTHVVDPLVFGYFSLAFGLMCLVSIAPRDWRKGARWGVLLRLAGLALGVYFSIRSGSRTGWLAVPLVVGIWAYHHWGRGHRVGTAASIAAAVLLPVLAYFTIPLVAARVDAGVQEFVKYPWNGVQVVETSVGWRITYLRMAWDMVAQNPWAGWGDMSRVPPLPASAFSYAAPQAVASAFASGFHNQLVSNTVRHGVAGLASTALLLLVPLLLCARGLRRGEPAARRDALMGVAYGTCLVVSSFSTEVVDLKFAASFYAVMTAALCGSALSRRNTGAD